MQMEMEMFQNEFLEEDVPLPQQSFFDNAEMVSTGICTHKSWISHVEFQEFDG